MLTEKFSRLSAPFRRQTVDVPDEMFLLICRLKL